MNREAIQSLPPDLYSRNTTITFVAQKLIPESGSRVLDVGGYQGQLAAFFPEETEFITLDKNPKPEGYFGEYIQADAQKIPFSDKNFDLVIGSDLLEHVEKPFRAPVIREMLRVSKNYVILGLPCKNELLEKAESYICDQFKRVTGTEHPFLKEHHEYGLPEEEKIESILRKEGVNYTIIKEGNLMNWYIQQLYAVVQHGEDVQSAQHEFYKFFNEHLSELGNLRAPTYRTIFVIAKEGSALDESVITELGEQSSWNPQRFMQLLQKAFNDLKQKMVAGTHLAMKDRQIAEQEARLQKARNVMETYKTTLKEVRDFLQEKERTITFLKEMTSQKDETITALEQEREQLKQNLTELEQQSQKQKEDIQQMKSRARENEQKIQEYERELGSTKTSLEATEQELNSHQRELQKVINSRAWKAILFYGRMKAAVWTKPVTLIKKGWDILIHMGPKVFWQRLVRKMKKQPTTEAKDAYQKFVEQQTPTTRAQKKAEEQIPAFQYQPRVSIIMPTYNIQEEWLRKAIQSVQKQWYTKWELCICDDASTDEDVRATLKEFAQKDSRVKTIFREKNGGIVKASNDALKLATGAYVGFLDNDDELTPDALYEMVKALQEEKYDFLYSDEDKLDMDGHRCDPFFKPDWSPDLLLSQNYTCHFSLYRKTILDELGGLREGFDGSQDYDLVLRFTEKTKKVKHIARILYHWRKVRGSTAAEVEAKPYAFIAAKKALSEAMKRRGVEAEITDGIWKGSYRVKRKVEGNPLVSIIIPFKDKVEVLKPCVESVLKKTTWNNYEILLVNNQSEQPETREYLEQFKYNQKIRVLEYDKPFNFSAINNFAAEEAKGDYLILLNNDIEVISPDWIQSMLEHAQRQEVGAVGAKLMYPNETIQHAGVVVGLNGIANHAFAKTPRDAQVYFGQADVIRNYSAVTAACLMVRKEVYHKMNGLNESQLAIAFNDVDFCLRLREKGYLIVYTPFAQLYHHESYSRGYDVAMKEVQYMQRRHGSLLKQGDPYYNQNLTRERFDFSLRVEDKIVE